MKVRAGLWVPVLARLGIPVGCGCGRAFEDAAPRPGSPLLAPPAVMLARQLR